MNSDPTITDIIASLTRRGFLLDKPNTSTSTWKTSKPNSTR